MPKILIADDSIAVRKVAERLLTEAGLTVVLAANGEEALAYLAKERPDVVVSDVIMPDKSGYEVCAFVRGNATIAGTPVLLISGIVNDEVTKQAEACRADGVLKKPFQGTSLKDRILELLAKRSEPVASAATPPASIPAAVPPQKTMPVAEPPQPSLPQDSSQLREVEQQLQAERTRSEELNKRLFEATAQLAIERQRVNELQEKVTKFEQQAARIPDLESALKAERDAVGTLKQEALNWQKTASRTAELESALTAERAAAEQLVQQLADLEGVSAKTMELEARLVNDQQQIVELQQKRASLEAEVLNERTKGKETSERLLELEKAAARVVELEGLVSTERERNEVLTRQVAETEQAAENATKRFEEMARKLGEIAGLASQLGHAKGQP